MIIIQLYGVYHMNTICIWITINSQSYGRMVNRRTKQNEPNRNWISIILRITVIENRIIHYGWVVVQRPCCVVDIVLFVLLGLLFIALHFGAFVVLYFFFVVLVINKSECVLAMFWFLVMLVSVCLVWPTEYTTQNSFHAPPVYNTKCPIRPKMGKQVYFWR